MSQNLRIVAFQALGEMEEERKKKGKDGIVAESSLLKTTKEFMKRKLGRYLRDEVGTVVYKSTLTELQHDIHYINIFLPSEIIDLLSLIFLLSYASSSSKRTSNH